MRGVGSISFQIASSDVLELSDIILVLGLRKNLLSISCMTNVQWRVAFKGQQCTISDCRQANPKTLARGVRKGGL